MKLDRSVQTAAEHFGRDMAVHLLERRGVTRLQLGPRKLAALFAIAYGAGLRRGLQLGGVELDPPPTDEEEPEDAT